MACLHDPAARPPLGIALFEVDLLAAGTDVRCEFAVLEQVADGREVVGLVEAEALGTLLGGLGTLDRDRVERSLQKLVVVAVCTVVVEPDRDSGSLDEE